MCRLLRDSSVVKIVQDGNIEIVFEKSIKHKLCWDKKFYTVFPMKLCDKIKDLITFGANVAYWSYPMRNDRDNVYFKINFGDKIITDPENTDQNESLENMAIKPGSVLNIEIATYFDDQKVLTENGWVKAIDIIEQNENEQQEKEDDESKEEEIKQKETNLIDENTKKAKEDHITDSNTTEQKKQNNYELEKIIEEQKDDLDLIDENQQQQKENVKVNFNFLNQDKISDIKDPENTDQNESLENMAIKQGSVLNIEIATKYDDQKVLTENGWVKAIDIIEQNKNKQQEEGNYESKEKGIKPKETNLIDENPQQQKENVKVNSNSLNQDKISDIKFSDNKISVSNHGNQKSSSNLWRILLFIVGVLSLAASLVVFLVSPELLALIIPLAFFGGFSLLVGFLWNTIKSCLWGSNPEGISMEPLSKTSKYDPNKITDLIDPNNNLLLKKDTLNKNEQE